MSEINTNNKRILRNTILLYVRMLIMMAIGLYSSRVILNALGVSDYGLYNVVGSVVTMFSFLTTTMASGTQRFLSFALGENNSEKLRAVFSNAIFLHFILAILVFLLSETLGLWYVYNKLVIDTGRFTAALWSYQLSVVASIFTIIQIPFNSALIAHEKMDFYAYMSIFDVTVKLIAIFTITLVPYDKLIFYSLLILVVNILSLFIYKWYCSRHFHECTFKPGYDKPLFREMLSFSGWNTFGCLAVMGQTTGVNLVINAFCGTIVNAARAIAIQVNAIVMRFVDNIQVAINPQIVKYYADNDIANMEKLAIRGAYLSSYLFLFLAIPLFIECEWVITLWLGNCPDYVVPFIQIVLVESLFKTMGNPTITVIHATGKMKMNQLTSGLLQLLVLPLCYILFRLGLPTTLIIAICIFPWILVIPLRLYWCHYYGNFPIWNYIRLIYIKIPLLACLMYIIPKSIHLVWPQSSLTRFLLVGIVSVITSIIIIYFCGFEDSVRKKLLEKFYNIFKFLKPTRECEK